MFKATRPILLIFAGLSLAFASSTLAPSSVSQRQGLPSATVTSEAISITPTAIHEAEMVPGETTIILLLGMILVLIIISAIMWHRRDWEI